MISTGATACCCCWQVGPATVAPAGQGELRAGCTVSGMPHGMSDSQVEGHAGGRPGVPRDAAIQKGGSLPRGGQLGGVLGCRPALRS